MCVCGCGHDSYMEVTTLDSKETLTRQCVYILDKIYSNYDCTFIIKLLHDIEVKLFDNFYSDQTQFIQDILTTISLISKDDLDQWKNKK